MCACLTYPSPALCILPQYDDVLHCSSKSAVTDKLSDIFSGSKTAESGHSPMVAVRMVCEIQAKLHMLVPYEMPLVELC